MAAITIRASAPQDAAAVEALRLAGWQNAYRGIIPDSYLDALRVDVDRRRRRLSLPGEVSDVVAVRDDAVVGWASAGPCRDPDRPGPRHGEIFACYVHPRAWRTGTGRMLLAAALAHLAQAGRDDVTLWVLEANQRARSFYAALGFAPDGARKLIEFGVAVPEVRYLRPAGSLSPHFAPIPQT